MTDFRALCVELIESVLSDNSHIDCMDIARRARAALAQPEPEVVEPTDAQLIEEAIAVGLAFQPQDEVSEVFLPFDAEEPLDELLVNFARAVLARWGNHAPQPPTEGEVEELVAWLRSNALTVKKASGNPANGARQRMNRAAELLERLSPPQPVPVSERWPEFSDCDDTDRVWCWNWAIDAWRLNRINRSIHSHWLPAQALPLPGQEVSND